MQVQYCDVIIVGIEKKILRNVTKIKIKLTELKKNYTV